MVQQTDFLRNQSRSWEKIKENFKTSAKDRLDLYGLKKRKPCSRFLDKRMKVKMQWLFNQNQRNVNSLNNENAKLAYVVGIHSFIQ